MTIFKTAVRPCLVGLLALGVVGASASAYAADDPMVGGAPMYSTKTIAENASQAKNLTTLVAAVKAAGLVETLSGPGPFTVFAPTNAAFDKLPPGTVDKLVQPDMKPTLTKVLTYHVVAGKVSAADLKKEIMSMGGSASLKTVEGGAITAKMDGDKVVLVDPDDDTPPSKTRITTFRRISMISEGYLMHITKFSVYGAALAIVHLHLLARTVYSSTLP